MNVGTKRVWDRVRAGVAFALALCGWSAPAEVTWLKPERFEVTPGALLTLDVLVAPEFGSTGAIVSGKELREATGRLGDTPLVILPVGAVTGRPHMTVTLPKPGVAVITANLAPEMRTLRREVVEAYLLAIHAPDGVTARWMEMPAAADWREMRIIRVKTCVRVGEPPAMEEPWRRRRDDGIDLAPERDPTGLRAGGTLAVRVARDGQPAVGVLVTFLSAGETREHVVVTDTDGRAKAELDAAGLWLVRASAVEPVLAADHDWRVETVILTVEVR